MKNKILEIILIILIIINIITIVSIIKSKKDNEVICYKNICIDNIRKVCFPNE